MSDTQKTEYDLKALAEGVFQRPSPESCGEIAELLSALPMSGSLGTPSPTAEPYAHHDFTGYWKSDDGKVLTLFSSRKH